MAWKFPTDQLDSLDSYAFLTGSFWTELFGGVDNVFDFFQTFRLAERQLFGQQQELQNTVGRQTCPVFHTQNYYHLALLASQTQHLTSGGTAFPLPAEVKDCQVVMSGIAVPSSTWHRGAGFVLDVANQQIVFSSNPFAEPGLEASPVLDDAGNVVDSQLDLWLFKASLDWLYLFEQFGYVVNINLPSGPRYKDLLNAVWDAAAASTGFESVAAFVEAICDVRRASFDGEVVSEVVSNPSGFLVITDREAYRFKAGSTPVVTAGQTLRAGDPLVDTVRIVDLTTGRVPAVLAALTLDSRFLLADLVGPLTFPNQAVSLNVQTNVSGYTKLTWALGGNPSDVTTFFNDLHANGVAAGKTLANYLDQRVSPVGQPGPNDLPSTINPLQFLAQNVLRPGCLVVLARTALFGPNALPASAFSSIRQVMPPHQALIPVLG